MSTWAHSNNGEDGWSIVDSREEAIEAGKEQAEHDLHDRFWIAPATLEDIADVVAVLDADWAIEALVEGNHDTLPEDSNWLEAVPAVAKNALSASLRDVTVAWLRQHNLAPDWYAIGKVEEHPL